MRKNGNMFEWAIEVAVVVAIVLLLMGYAFGWFRIFRKRIAQRRLRSRSLTSKMHNRKGEAFCNPTIWMAVSTM